MEIVLRVAVLYAFILVGLRVLGKRELGQMSPTELIALLLIPEIASQALVGEDFSVTSAIIGVSTLLVLVFLNSLLTYASRRYEQIMESSPTVLVYSGRLIERNLAKERVTSDEVFSEMRKAGLERLGQVRWAILEGDGKIAIVPHEGNTAQRQIREHLHS